MNIAYCTNVRLPSERAHGHQIAQVCDALITLGHNVTLFAPRRCNPIQENYHHYYDAHQDLHVQYLRSFDHNACVIPLGVLGMWVSNVLLQRQLKTVLQKSNFDLLYTRTIALLPGLLSTNIPTVLELHSLPKSRKQAFVRQCNQCKLVVCLTSPMRDELLQWGVDTEKVIVEGDAMSPTLFADKIRADVWRYSCSIPNGAPIVGYTGQLHSMGLSKGVEVLLEALTHIAECHALIAGGPDTVAQKMMKSMPSSLRERVHFLGVLPHQDIPSVLRACDVLVYPAPKSSHPFYQRDTSPLKLFEYMAAGRPIVCADIPPVRDTVNESHVTFFDPGDVQGLAHAIRQLLQNPNQDQVNVAKRHVEQFTWEKRMGRIFAVLRER